MLRLCCLIEPMNSLAIKKMDCSVGSKKLLNIESIKCSKVVSSPMRLRVIKRDRVSAGAIVPICSG